MDQDFTREFSDVQRQLEAVQDLLIDAVKNCFRGKNISAIKNMIQGDSDDILLWLHEIAIESESYEICAAIKEILDERNILFAANSDAQNLNSARSRLC